MTPKLKQRYAAPRYPLEPLAKGILFVQYGCSDLANGEGKGLRIVRMNNLQAEGWDFSDVKHVPLALAAARRYRLKPGDVLFNRTNSKELVGKCEVFREPGVWVFASYLIRIRFDEQVLLPDFAVTFLNTAAGRLQIDRVSRQIIGMTNINAEELQALVIPLPSPAKQSELVAVMDAARAARRAKLSEADTLLAGLDGFLLDTLGLMLPPHDNRKVFAVQQSMVQSRADADFHSPRFRLIREGIENGLYPPHPLAELCDTFETGFAAGKQDQAFDYELGLPHLRPLNLNIYGELSLADTKFVPKVSVSHRDCCQPGEVLFNNTNSAELVGKSAVFDLAQLCACSNHMTRLSVRAGVNAYYLAALLNALRSTGYLGLLSTKFNNQAGINLDTLKPLRVPCPPESVQTQIADEARRRREEARRLRAEAEADWQAAKQWFEMQLLGDPGS